MTEINTNDDKYDSIKLAGLTKYQLIKEIRSLITTIESLQSEISSHGPEGRNYTNQQYVELLLNFESQKEEIEVLLKDNFKLRHQIESLQKENEQLRHRDRVVSLTNETLGRYVCEGKEEIEQLKRDNAALVRIGNQAYADGLNASSSHIQEGEK